ncbi:RodZ family helix-turn-helix domain-containing protein [Mycolicibacterium stellerae]|uniref:hypothetical protein n=1 Tax=Mycolicibacterium stellerae TaxID=2358193 RepID=UPI001F40574E|nr:hypothetical protein [Mycolicibacterium stellerae]
MTTHDMQPEMVDPAVRADRPAEAQRLEPPLETGDATPNFEAPADTAQAPVDTAQAPADTAQAPVETAPPADMAQAPVDDPVETAGSSDQMLFADGELTDMRSRWTEVQSAFVDDPRDCVQKADSLVADVVDKLTAGFSGARAHLEEQWSRGEEVSTEDLRIALKRYREFFERLLAV